MATDSTSQWGSTINSGRVCSVTSRQLVVLIYLRSGFLVWKDVQLIMNIKGSYTLKVIMYLVESLSRHRSVTVGCKAWHYLA